MFTQFNKLVDQSEVAATTFAKSIPDASVQKMVMTAIEFNVEMAKQYSAFTANLMATLTPATK